MSKKHFVAIAEALRSEKPGENWDPNKRVQWMLDVRAIARVLASYNAAFDLERFLTAAGADQFVPGESRVFGKAQVYDNARIFGKPEVR